MPKYIFAYHGGGKPDSPEEGEKQMAKWMVWFEAMGPAVVDGGNPVGLSSTVYHDRVEDNGGANPLSGYSIIEATDHAAANELAKGCRFWKMVLVRSKSPRSWRCKALSRAQSF